MKVEYKLFAFLFVFFALVSVGYYLSSLAVYGHVEPIGETVFLLTTLMNGMITFYLFTQSRRLPARYEDDKHGEVADGAGVLGFFPPSSIWPFWCALTAMVLLMGPIFGWWITILGAVMGIWAVCGWCYEFYVGEYQH